MDQDPSAAETVVGQRPNARRWFLPMAAVLIAGLLTVAGLYVRHQRQIAEEREAFGRLSNVPGLLIVKGPDGHAHSAQGALRDELLDDVARLHWLKVLTINDCPVTDAGVAKLAGMRSLSAVALSGTKITDAAADTIVTWPNVESLYLDGTGIGDEAVEEISGLGSLRILGLSGTKITDRSMAHVAELPGLKWLLIADTAVGDEGAAALCDAANLGRLSAPKTRITDAGKAKLAAALPSLTIDEQSSGAPPDEMLGEMSDEAPPAGETEAQDSSPAAGEQPVSTAVQSESAPDAEDGPTP